MGRRSRKRTGPGGPVARSVVVARVVPPPGRADRRARATEAPRAPWAPFPLVELAILVGIVCIVAGVALAREGSAGLVVAGLALVTVAGLELAIREHRAGYRSHSVLLAGALSIVLVLPLFFLTRLPSEVLLILGAVFFAAGVQGFRGTFLRRTGGLGFRA